jgi:hypothetical protein
MVFYHKTIGSKGIVRLANMLFDWIRGGTLWIRRSVLYAFILG